MNYAEIINWNILTMFYKFVNCLEIIEELSTYHCKILIIDIFIYITYLFFIL